jgi:hypothetical protein
MDPHRLLRVAVSPQRQRRGLDLLRVLKSRRQSPKVQPHQRGEELLRPPVLVFDVRDYVICRPSLS